MTRLAIPILALALGVGAAFGLVSCGGDEEGLLPGDNAQEIVDNLNEVEQLSEAGDCAGADAAADEVQMQIDELGSQVDEQLVARLEEGATELEQVIAEDCDVATIPTVETTTETTDTTTEETESTTTETTTEPSTTTSTTTTSTVPPTVPTTGEGGGVTPPLPEEEDG